MNQHRLVLSGMGAPLNRPRRSVHTVTGLSAAWRFTVVALTLVLIAALVVVLRYVVFEHFHGDDHLLRAALEAIGAL
jgi:hypothetical protein